MSYLGFVGHICRDYLPHIQGNRGPRVLEIGLDRGQSTLPMLHNMVLNSCKNNANPGFEYFGVDILLKEEFMTQLTQLSDLHIGSIESLLEYKTGTNQIYLSKSNSLDFLDLKSNNIGGYSFDLVLIDGDHNYYTVKKELELLEKNQFLNPWSVIICDDYLGRYSEKDMFYHNREEYENNELATNPKNIAKSDKSGVKAAVDDFIKNSKLPYSIWYGVGEPCLIFRSDFFDIEFNVSSNWESSRFIFNKIAGNDK